MNSARFAEIYEGLTSKEAALFNVKKNQYAFDDERLHNFIQAAKIEGRRPSQIAFSYFTKHLISIQKAIDSQQYELYWERLTEAGDKDECIVQRFADARNYMLLMLCCLEHEADQPVSFETKAAESATAMSLSDIDKAIIESFLPEIERALEQSSARPPYADRTYALSSTALEEIERQRQQYRDFYNGSNYDPAPEEVD